MHVHVAFAFCQIIESCPDFVRTRWSFKQPFHECPQIESSAPDNDGNPASIPNLTEDLTTDAKVIPGCKDLIRFQQIHQVMPHAPLLRRAQLGAANIEVFIDLNGITADYLSVEPTTKFNG